MHVRRPRNAQAPAASAHRVPATDAAGTRHACVALGISADALCARHPATSAPAAGPQTQRALVSNPHLSEQEAAAKTASRHLPEPGPAQKHARTTAETPPSMWVCRICKATFSSGQVRPWCASCHSVHATCRQRCSSSVDHVRTALHSLGNGAGDAALMRHVQQHVRFGVAPNLSSSAAADPVGRATCQTSNQPPAAGLAVKASRAPEASNVAPQKTSPIVPEPTKLKSSTNSASAVPVDATAIKPSLAPKASAGPCNHGGRKRVGLEESNAVLGMPRALTADTRWHFSISAKWKMELTSMHAQVTQYIQACPPLQLLPHAPGLVQGV